MRNALVLVPAIVALVLFEGYCLLVLWREGAKLVPRWVWALLILASVPLGGILFLVLGRAAPEPVAADVQAPAPPVVAPAAAAVRTDAVVSTTGLRKRYGGVAALDGISLSVPAGSVFGIVGPNGAGKTTLLAILAGLRRPDDGTFAFGRGRAQVALLPDTPHFEPWLTGREVVDLARVLARPDSAPAQTDEALARTGLTGAADRRTGGYSRGMLQRLGLAATIVGEPDVLLLDEPCSALDPSGRREVLDLVGRLRGRHTVLFCSHILDDVQEVCDGVGILQAGRLLFQGELDELLTGQAAPSFTVRVRGSADALATELARQPWVTTVARTGPEEVQITAPSATAAGRGIGPALAASGAVLVSVVPAGADLEKVFLELTR